MATPKSTFLTETIVKDKQAVMTAADQDAFIFWNHPAGKLVLSKVLTNGSILWTNWSRKRFWAGLKFLTASDFIKKHSTGVLITTLQ